MLPSSAKLLPPQEKKAPGSRCSLSAALQRVSLSTRLQQSNCRGTYAFVTYAAVF